MLVTPSRMLYAAALGRLCFGVGAHIWDARTTLPEAYGVLFELWAANRAAGARPMGWVELLREVVRYKHRNYPLT